MWIYTKRSSRKLGGLMWTKAKYESMDLFLYFYKTKQRSSRKLVRVDVDEVRKYIFLTFLLVHLNKIVPPLRLQPSTRHEMMQVNRVGGGGVAAPPPPPPPPLLRWSCLLLSSLFSSCCCSMTCSN